ncbi:hypothetical protein JY98_03715 [Exiguobacterium mexicanum]|nr:hypothetical protein JY98_03715 [Exiguobacterium mexicanum]
MIKPYIKSEHTATVVEVEEHGIINLNYLPLKVRVDEEGEFEIGWVGGNIDGKEDYVLSEVGGRNRFDYSGRHLGVLREVR